MRYRIIKRDGYFIVQRREPLFPLGWLLGWYSGDGYQIHQTLEDAKEEIERERKSRRYTVVYEWRPEQK